MPQRTAVGAGTLELREDRLVGAVDGRDPEHRGRPEARVDRGRDQHGQRARDPGGEDGEGGLDDRHLLELAVIALPAGVAQAGELLAHAGRRRPAVDLRMVGRQERELGGLDGAGVGREQREREAVQRLGVQLHAIDAPEHGALRADRALVPAGQLGEAAVVLLGVGAPADVPLRAPHEPHRPVTAPALAAFGLLAGEHRPAALAPVDRALALVDEAAFEQHEEQPLRPAVDVLVAAHERARPVEGEAEGVELLAHPGGAGVDPFPRREPVFERSELGRQPERVEAERVEHRVTAGAPEAGVGVADRVAADVAHVRGARGERVAVEDMHVPAALDGLGRRLERVGVPPGLLPLRLDDRGVVDRRR